MIGSKRRVKSTKCIHRSHYHLRSRSCSCQPYAMLLCVYACALCHHLLIIYSICLTPCKILYRGLHDKCFEVRISNDLALEWLVIAIVIVPTTGYPNKKAAILFKTEHHWKTEQRATIGILNVFGIPALTVYSL